MSTSCMKQKQVNQFFFDSYKLKTILTELYHFKRFELHSMERERKFIQYNYSKTI